MAAVDMRSVAFFRSFPSAVQCWYRSLGFWLRGGCSVLYGMDGWGADGSFYHEAEEEKTSLAFALLRTSLGVGKGQNYTVK